MILFYKSDKFSLCFYVDYSGQNRIEDAALREHLLSLTPSESSQGFDRTGATGRSGLELKTATELPRWFVELLERDRELKNLWFGTGKPAHLDTSRSGYDYGVVNRLLRLGYRDIDELATILSLRPGGAAPERAQRM